MHNLTSMFLVMGVSLVAQFGEAVNSLKWSMDYHLIKTTNSPPFRSLTQRLYSSVRSAVTCLSVPSQPHSLEPAIHHLPHQSLRSVSYFYVTLLQNLVDCHIFTFNCYNSVRTLQLYFTSIPCQNTLSLLTFALPHLCRTADLHSNGGTAGILCRVQGWQQRPWGLTG